MADMIKDYKVIKEIGSGGMGKVYKALHPGLKTHVIIKELHASGATIDERFKREAKIMMSLRHDNIVPVYDYFIENKKKYIVMEYVHGVSLAEIIKARKQMDPKAALMIFSEASKGLEYAHQKKIIHRDLKPANILISKKGEVKIIDFGIASYYDDGEDKTQKKETEETLTQTGMAFGTPAYMSPEQIGDTKNVMPQSDIFSMGVILYEMLTGLRPFSNAFTTEALSQRIKENYNDVKYEDKSLPAILQKVIEKCLKPKTSQRYKSIGAAEKKLSSYLKGMNHKDILLNISEYSFNGKFVDSINTMKPLYSSLWGSLSESRSRKILIRIFIPTAIILALLYSLLFTDIYYMLFKRSTVGKLQVNYHLTIRPVLYKFWWYKKWGVLPDEKKYPGLYAERVKRVEKAVTEYIKKNYQDKLFNFQVTALLLKRRAPGKKILSTEKIKMYPRENLTIEGSDFTFKLNKGRKIPSYITFTSGTIFRPKGYYSTKIFQSATSYREYISLPALSEQEKTTVIDTYYATTPRNRVNFEFEFIDKNTGKKINDVKILIWIAKKYLPYEDVLKDEKLLKRMTNGWYYYFIITHDDYISPGKIYLWVGRDESVARLKMKLIKKKKKNK